MKQPHDWPTGDLLTSANYPPRARTDDPATSHAAAASMESAAERHKRLILAALAKRPMTATEIGAFTGLTQVQVCRRLPELEEAGLAAPTGELRKTESGRQSREWSAT